ncbi:hypothetical protein G7066_09905 [Leucobacter coleopterorum]|uniref:DNA polymerase III subunit gamma/tau n=1 Tax=Leucobacter coleopterorum TaxID=2714933 RepID=A0ABX6JX50_9MICO|nr:hypothetical protein [Leucobacter coleopterorum]QIM18828.1 hypothetical protein G7066_09905 [Leucobacter coleopterorum]
MRKKKEQAARDSTLASGWKVEGEEPIVSAEEDTVAPEGQVTQVASDAEPAAPGLSNGALVTLGVFGGLYLLYVWGWFIIAQAYASVNAMAAAGSGTIGGVLQQIVFWAAPLAPVLWFGLSLLFSRGGRTRRLVLFLFIGAIVLMPLPMLIARGS